MAKRVKIENYTFKISLDKLSYLIDVITDLTKLDDSVVMNFDNNNLLLFSVVGRNIDNVHAFKSHILPISDIFLPSKNKLESEIRYILNDAKKFATSMKVFVKYMKSQEILDEINFKLYYNEFFCERLEIKNSKSKEETPGGKPNNHTHNLDVDDIDSVMDKSLANYSFELSKIDYEYIKSKTNIEKDNDVLYLNIENNMLNIGETRWQHNITELELEDKTISFPKKYFKCINYDKNDIMKIYVTDTFLLISGDDTNLLISIELTI